MVDLNEPATSELLLELLQTDDLDSIVQHASRVVGNPIALLDSTYHILAYSSADVPNDDYWNRGMRNRVWNYELVAKINSVLNISDDGRLHKPIILDNVSAHRRRFAALEHKGVFLGYLVILEIGTSLEDIDDGVYALIDKVLAKALRISRAASLRNSPGNIKVFLVDLLSGRFNEPILFRERIKGSKLAQLKEAQILCISLAGYAPEDLYEERLENGIREIFPASWSVPEGSNIIVLLDYAEVGERENEIFLKFTAFLEDNNLSAGRSSPFTDLYHMPEYRDKALRAMELAREFSGNSLYPGKLVLADYEDFALPDMISRLSPEHLKFFCNSKIYSIYLYDREHDTGYVPTLFHYLNSGKSMHKAAVGLFVHHNTVYYRVNKIKELFSMDLENEYRNLQYYFSCLILMFFIQH